MNRKSLLILTLLVFGGFFSQGCTSAQRKEYFMEGLEAAKEYVSKEVTPKIAELAEKKIKEKEDKELKALDLQLAQFKITDPETNETITKTWKDFDSDKSGDLSFEELFKVSSFVTTQTAKKVASGEISKNEAGSIAKGTGATLMTLLLLLLGKRGVSKFAKNPTPPTPATH